MEERKPWVEAPVTVTSSTVLAAGAAFLAGAAPGLAGAALTVAFVGVWPSVAAGDVGDAAGGWDCATA